MKVKKSIALAFLCHFVILSLCLSQTEDAALGCESEGNSQESNGNEYRDDSAVDEENRDVFFSEHEDVDEDETANPLIIEVAYPLLKEVGQIEPVKWKNESGEDVTTTTHAYRVGLPTNLVKEMNLYCDLLGITNIFSTLTSTNYNSYHAVSPIEIDDDYLVLRNGKYWYSHPTSSHMRKMSPADADSHQHVLRILESSGLDSVLERIGYYFGLVDLTVYQLSFSAVSSCDTWYDPHDFTSTDGKAFALRIPLKFKDDDTKLGESVDADGLHIQSIINGKVALAGMRYEHNVGALFGDKTHAAIHCHDSMAKGKDRSMRMGLTLYLAEIKEENAEEIMKHIKQEYPYKDHDWFLKQKGLHWGHGLSLPRLSADSHTKYSLEKKEDFLNSPLKPGQIEPIKWSDGDTGLPVTKFAFRVGIPPNVTKGLTDYCDSMGFTKRFKSLTIGNKALDPDHDEYFSTENGLKWYLQRPESKWQSDMHWLSPADDGAQNDYLDVLEASGFYQVLDSIGKYFGMDGLVSYQLTFIAVSNCTQGYKHQDFSNTSGKAFNLIIPLILVDDAEPELDVVNAFEEHSLSPPVGRLKYEYNVGAMVGDAAFHATSACDYSNIGGMRMAATVYLADVNEDNVEGILRDYTQAYPPVDKKILLSQKGRHWRKNK